MNYYYIYTENSIEISPQWQIDRIIVETDQKLRTTLKALVNSLQSGDALLTGSILAVCSHSAEFLKLMDVLVQKKAAFVSVREQVNTADETGRSFLSACQALIALDRENQTNRQHEGEEAPRKEKEYRGRKPIKVDDAHFAHTLDRWQRGEITARQAMQEHNLKPNTFYRRVKERAEHDRNSIKNAVKEIKTGSL